MTLHVKVVKKKNSRTLQCDGDKCEAYGNCCDYVSYNYGHFCWNRFQNSTSVIQCVLTAVGSRWERWICAFILFADGRGVDAKKQKKALM